jgi:23S rRNA C2498 (ribose-2'-O)-methylase RlmM
VAIMTLKITPDDALRTVRSSLDALSDRYEILHARQLYHHRNEVTVVARKRAEGRLGRRRSDRPRADCR